MKTKIMGVIGMLCAVIAFTGCNLTDSQKKVVAQNAGLGAAITWIAYDNPSTNETAFVSAALNIISENANGISAGVTYTELLFDDMEKFAKSDIVPDNYASIVIAGSLAALNGLDLLFASNPEWIATQDLSVEIVKSFVKGAQMGLALSSDDPRIENARVMSTRRARMFKAD